MSALPYLYYEGQGGKLNQVSDTYHREELRIALDPSHPAHILPPVVRSGAMVLDLGCGAGQTLIAAYPGQTTFGIDIDLPTLQLGQTWSRDVRFCCGKAEELPYHDSTFNLVIARVSLAYTDIERTLNEANRVLKPEGKLWVTLHSWRTPVRMARQSGWRGKVYFAYILANSLSLHFFDKEFSWFGKHESFQTRSRMRKMFKKCGFDDIHITRDRHFLVEARVVKAADVCAHSAALSTQTT